MSWWSRHNIPHPAENNLHCNNYCNCTQRLASQIQTTAMAKGSQNRRFWPSRSAETSWFRSTSARPRSRVPLWRVHFSATHVRAINCHCVSVRAVSARLMLARRPLARQTCTSSFHCWGMFFFLWRRGSILYTTYNERQCSVHHHQYTQIRFRVIITEYYYSTHTAQHASLVHKYLMALSFPMFLAVSAYTHYHI